MDRRCLLGFALMLGCAKGSAEGPTSFGLPTGSATQPSPSDSGESQEDSGSDSSGNSGGGDGTTAEQAEGSSGSPVSTADDSSDGGVTLDPTAEASTSVGDPSASASASASMTDPSTDSGVEPPPAEVGAWEDCAAATCEVGSDCITVTGLDNNDPYCSPQCVSDFDCPLPASGDATPYCALVADNAVDPTNCALVCESDGFDLGTCPNGMVCTSIPGQNPTISLCMW